MNPKFEECDLWLIQSTLNVLGLVGAIGAMAGDGGLAGVLNWGEVGLKGLISARLGGCGGAV